MFPSLSPKQKNLLIKYGYGESIPAPNTNTIIGTNVYNNPRLARYGYTPPQPPPLSPVQADVLSSKILEIKEILQNESTKWESTTWNTTQTNIAMSKGIVHELQSLVVRQPSTDGIPALAYVAVVLNRANLPSIVKAVRCRTIRNNETRRLREQEEIIRTRARLRTLLSEVIDTTLSNLSNPNTVHRKCDGSLLI